MYKATLISRCFNRYIFHFCESTLSDLTPSLVVCLYVYCQASGDSSAVQTLPQPGLNSIRKNEIRPHAVLNQPYRQLNNSMI